jgi:hypothetical protein
VSHWRPAELESDYRIGNGFSGEKTYRWRRARKATAGVRDYVNLRYEDAGPVGVEAGSVVEHVEGIQVMTRKTANKEAIGS